MSSSVEPACRWCGGDEDRKPARFDEDSLECLPCRAHNARVAAEDRLLDEEEDRRLTARFESLCSLLRECYPTVIPESWLK